TDGQSEHIIQTLEDMLRAWGFWKRISDKRTKNEAKNDKTEHRMEEHEKDKVKSKPKSKSQSKVNLDKVKGQRRSQNRRNT
ncbi:hypothetical protein Tco_1147565, partial [Tanacetum coccineum]